MGHVSGTLLILTLVISQCQAAYPGDVFQTSVSPLETGAGAALRFTGVTQDIASTTWYTGGVNGTYGAGASAGDWDYVLMAADSLSNPTIKCQGGSSEYDLATAVRTNPDWPAEYVWVLGTTEGVINATNVGASPVAPDLFLARWTVGGDLLFTMQMDSGSRDYSCGMAIDATTREVYTHSLMVVGLDIYATVISYSDEGAVQKNVTRLVRPGLAALSWPDQCGGLALHSTFVYLAETTYDGMQMDTIVYRFDTSAGWAEVQKQFGHATGADGARAVYADTSGVFVAGYTVGGFSATHSYAGGKDGYLTKLDLGLSASEWTIQVGTGTDETAAAMEGESYNNITSVVWAVLTDGSLVSGSSGGIDIASYRVDSLGGAVGTTGSQYGSAQNEYVFDIHIDPFIGEILMAGHIDTAAGTTDASIVIVQTDWCTQDQGVYIGSSWNGSACMPCPAGQYQPTYYIRHSQCESCTSGGTTGSGEAACGDCPAGHYLSGAFEWYASGMVGSSLVPRYSCYFRSLPCLAGHYQSQSGQFASCNQCWGGSYQNLTGQTSCHACGVDTYSSAGATSCQQCNGEQTAPSNSSSCTGGVTEDSESSVETVCDSKSSLDHLICILGWESDLAFPDVNLGSYSSTIRGAVGGIVAVHAGLALVSTLMGGASAGVASGAGGLGGATSGAGGMGGAGIGGNVQMNAKPQGSMNGVMTMIFQIQLVAVIESVDRAMPAGLEELARSMAWANLQFKPPFSVGERGEHRSLLVQVHEDGSVKANEAEIFVGVLFWCGIIMLLLVVVHAFVVGTCSCCCRRVLRRKEWRISPLYYFPRWELNALIIMYNALAVSAGVMLAGRADPIYISLGVLVLVGFLIPFPIWMFFFLHFTVGSRKHARFVPRRKGFFLCTRLALAADVLLQNHPFRRAADPSGTSSGFLGRTTGWLVHVWESAVKTGDWEGNETFLGRWDVMFGDFNRQSLYWGVVDVAFKCLRGCVLGLLAGTYFGGQAQATFLSVCAGIQFLWMISLGVYTDSYWTARDCFFTSVNFVSFTLVLFLPAPGVELTGFQVTAGALLTFLQTSAITIRVGIQLVASIGPLVLLISVSVRAVALVLWKTPGVVWRALVWAVRLVVFLAISLYAVLGLQDVVEGAAGETEEPEDAYAVAVFLLEDIIEKLPCYRGGLVDSSPAMWSDPVQDFNGSSLPGTPLIGKKPQRGRKSQLPLRQFFRHNMSQASQVMPFPDSPMASARSVDSDEQGLRTIDNNLDQLFVLEDCHMEGEALVAGFDHPGPHGAQRRGHHRRRSSALSNPIPTLRDVMESVQDTIRDSPVLRYVSRRLTPVLGVALDGGEHSPRAGPSSDRNPFVPQTRLSPEMTSQHAGEVARQMLKRTTEVTQHTSPGLRARHTLRTANNPLAAPVPFGMATIGSPGVSSFSEAVADEDMTIDSPREAQPSRHHDSR